MNKKYIALGLLSLATAAGMASLTTGDDAQLALRASLIDAKQSAVVADVSLEPFACDSALYLTQVKDGISHTQLMDSDANLQMATPVSEYKYNAVGINPVDGFLYGLSGKNIIRIGQNGEEKIGKTNAKGFSGAFMADGTYVVNDGSTLSHIDVSGPTLLTQYTMSGSFADIARNPQDGFYYGFNNATQRLSIIQVHTGESADRGPDQSAVIQQAGAAFFDGAGVLYLYGKTPESQNQDTLFRVDVQTSTITKVVTAEPVNGSDGASCVRGIDAPAEVEIPQEEPPVEEPVTETEPPTEVPEPEEEELIEEEPEEGKEVIEEETTPVVPEPIADVQVCKDLTQTQSVTASNAKRLLAQATYYAGACEPVLTMCLDDTETQVRESQQQLIEADGGYVGTCVIEMVQVCMKDTTQTIRKAATTQFLSEGATLGACIKGSDVTAGSFTQETISVCAPERKQCVAMFPTEKDALYGAYRQCLQTQKDQTECLARWAMEKGYETCTDNAQCRGEITVVEFPEITFEDGCFTKDDQTYCPHADEGSCVTIDDKTLCQSAEQQCVVVRISAAMPTAPTGAEYFQSRNQVHSEYKKFCVYDPADTGAFTVDLAPPTAEMGTTPTVGMCVNNTTQMLSGPVLLTPAAACVTTYPMAGTSPYYEVYQQCLGRGKDANTCARQWSAGVGQFCETDADCR